MEAILILLLILSFSFPLPSSTTTTKSTIVNGNETDMLSLLAFKNQLTQDSLSTSLSSWNDTNHFCSWIGVSCSNTKHPQRVTTLDLSYLSLAGIVSPSIANLTFLNNLTLSNNGFYGAIPPELGNMRWLQLLDLRFNSLRGQIPVSLTNCSDLMILDLNGNNLSGNIPEDVDSLAKLVHLDLSNNSFSGGIPSSVGNLSYLNFLFLDYNQLEGSIPSEIGWLHSLVNFGVSVNKLSGTIPSSLFNLSSLYTVEVAVNQLEGTLPTTMGLTLPNLQQIIFDNNQFEGPIPHSLPNASELFVIDLSTNNLSGKLPSNLGMLGSLSKLNLEFNLLETSDPNSWAFLTSLTNCSQLKFLALNHNNLSGELPISISNLSTHLQYLGIGHNKMSGHIPSGIGNLVNLTKLALGYNYHTGVIPEDIGKLKSLQFFQLVWSEVVGEIPSSFGNLTNLLYLYLQGNHLDGSLPPSLGNLQQLQYLDLEENRFSGTIPKEIFSLSSLRQCGLSDNSLVGRIPSEVNNMKYLGVLEIDGNKLTGEIPSELGNNQLLQVLDLSQNLLNGSIPSSFSNMKELNWLDISQNNLSGPLPHFLDSLSLTYLNLSFNHFEGEVPMKGIFQNATATSLQGNDGLCGGIRDYHLHSCPSKSIKRRGLSLLLKVVIATTSIVFGLFTSLLCMYCKNKSREENHVVPSSEDQYHRPSYIELAKATNGFSEANLIGTGSYGSVYKGTLDHSNTVVAVKVFHLEVQGASKSFIAEYEALRHIRHRNLIKILTTCSSIDSKGNDFKALVFEFMPNGNLDNDMVAHVGDFGLAKPMQDNDISSRSIGIRGTIGYVAPEYGQGGKVSTSGDVYSYGILVLEMFIGRRPVDDMFKDDHNLHKFVDMAFPDRVMKIIDRFLLLPNEGEDSSDEDKIGRNSRRGRRVEECITHVIEVGLSCSKESPRERTNMRAVAMELHDIRDALLGYRV